MLKHHTRQLNKWKPTVNKHKSLSGMFFYVKKMDVKTNEMDENKFAIELKQLNFFVRNFTIYSAVQLTLVSW